MADEEIQEQEITPDEAAPPVTEEEVPVAGDDLFDPDDEPNPSENESEEGNTDEIEADENASPNGEAEKPQADTSDLDADAVALAKAAGMTDEDIKTCSSTAELDSRIAWASRKGWLKAADPEDKTGPKPTPQPQPDEKPQAKDGEKPSVSSRKFALPEEVKEYEDVLVKAFEGMNDHYAKQIEELEAKTAKIEEAYRQVEEVAHRDAVARDLKGFDKEVEALGEEFSDLYGSGPTLELDPESAELKNRDAVFGEMLRMANDYRQMGMKVPPMSKLFDRAHHSVHGRTITTKAKQSAQQEITEAVKQQSRAAMGRPAAHNGKAKPKTGKEAAMKFQRDFLAKRGISEDFGESDDEVRDTFL